MLFLSRWIDVVGSGLSSTRDKWTTIPFCKIVVEWAHFIAFRRNICMAFATLHAHMCYGYSICVNAIPPREKERERKCHRKCRSPFQHNIYNQFCHILCFFTHHYASNRHGRKFPKYSNKKNRIVSKPEKNTSLLRREIEREAHRLNCAFSASECFMHAHIMV